MGACSVLCAPILFVDYFLLPEGYSMYFVYIPMFLLWVVTLASAMEKVPYLMGSLLSASFWQLDRSAWNVGVVHPVSILTVLLFVSIAFVIWWTLHRTKRIMPVIISCLAQCVMILLYLRFPRR
jgi:hypothetical protein